MYIHLFMYFDRIFPLRVRGEVVDEAISLGLNVSEAMRAGLDLAIHNRRIQKGALNGTVETSAVAGAIESIGTNGPVVRKKDERTGRFQDSNE